MRFERPRRSSQSSSPLPSVERLRSNLSSKLPSRTHYYRHGKAFGGNNNHYNLSYRRPLLSQEWEYSEEIDEEVDDFTEIRPVSGEGKYAFKSPRTPGSGTVSTAVTKPVKKVLSAMTLPSLRGGNTAYRAKNSTDGYGYDDDDDLESRDDDSRYLLKSLYDTEFMGKRQHLSNETSSTNHRTAHGQPVKEPTEEAIRELRQLSIKQHVRGGSVSSAGASSMTSFKQLHEDGASGCLHVVDFGGFDTSDNSDPSQIGEIDFKSEEGSSSSDKENAVAEELAKRDDTEQFSEDVDSWLRMTQESNVAAEPERVTTDASAGLKSERGLNSSDVTLARMSTKDSLAGLKISELSEHGSDVTPRSTDTVVNAEVNHVGAPQASTEYSMSEERAQEYIKPSLRMSADSLVGLKIDSEKGSDSSNGIEQATRTSIRSSIFGYSTGTSSNAEYPDDNQSIVTSGSSSTVDLDSHLTVEEKITGCPGDFLMNVYENDEPASVSADSDQAEYEKTPFDSVATDGQQSYITYASYATRQSPCPVTVTPTENGDVILMTPLDDIVDVGPQQQAKSAVVAQKSPRPIAVPAQAVGPATLGPKSALLIPSLESETDLKKVHLEPSETKSADQEEEDYVDATKIDSVYRRKSVVFGEHAKKTDGNNEASPTGVDELLLSDDEFTEVEFTVDGDQVGACAEYPSNKPPLPPMSREDSEFIACEGWDEDEDDESVSNSSQPFGSFEVYEDALSDILQSRRDPTAIELRPSLESDCGQSSFIVSSYVVSSSIAGASVVSDEVKGKSLPTALQEQLEEAETSRSLLDMAGVDEETSGGSRETCASLGSFSQIYTRTSLPEAEDSESESDAPGDYFDYSHEAESIEDNESKQDESSKQLEEVATSPPSDVSESSGETPDFMKELVQQRRASTGSRPWATKTDSDDSESACSAAGSDLISVPSASMSSSDSQEDANSVPRILLPKEDAPDIVTEEHREISDPDINMQDFDNLNNFWLNQWTEMASASAEEGSSFDTDKAKGLSDPDENQPHFFLKKDVGNAMGDEDNEVQNESNAAEKASLVEDNICTDCDGNHYLKIYDLDSGMDTYEVITHRSYDLETVNECSSKEEDEEESEKEAGKRKEEPLALKKPPVGSHPHHRQQKSVASLEDLHSLFDEYHATLSHENEECKVSTLLEDTVQPPAPPVSGLEFRSVRSSKKRHVHIKKRAIAKAKSERVKYDLAYLEKGSHRRSFSKEELNTSVDNDLSNDDDELNISPKVSTPKFAGTPKSNDYDESSIESMTPNEFHDSPEVSTPTFVGSSKNYEGDEESSFDSVTHKDYREFFSVLLSPVQKTDGDHLMVPTLEDVGSMKEEDDHSLSPSSVSHSLDSFASDMSEHSEKELYKDKSDSISRHPELNKGTSFMVIKLYAENMELAETLAATQSELEKITRKLERVTHERDEIILTARFEI